MLIFNVFKICNEITINKKIELNVIIFLSIIIPFLEVINLSLFLPIFETLVDSNSVSNYSNYVKNFFLALGINFSLKNLLIFVGVFLLLKIIVNILNLKLFVACPQAPCPTVHGVAGGASRTVRTIF